MNLEQVYADWYKELFGHKEILKSDEPGISWMSQCHPISIALIHDGYITAMSQVLCQDVK